MKKFALEAALFGGIALFVAGCPNPDLAETPMGQEEQNWNRAFRSDYPAYRFPRTASPAVADNVSDVLLKQEEQDRLNSATADQPVLEENAVIQENNSAGAPPEPVSDLAPGDKVVDAAAQAPAAPAKETAETPAPAPAAKAEVKAEAKPAAPKTVEKKAEAKAETANEYQEIYVVKAGDTLGSIARKYYGSASKADVLLRANKSKVKSAKQLRVGTKLVVPKF